MPWLGNWKLPFGIYIFSCETLNHEQVYSIRNRHRELGREEERVHEASYTHSASWGAGHVVPVRQLIVSLSDLSVCLGAGTSASTQVDLFFFSFVIVKRQNKTSYKTLGTSRKVPLLRTAGLEECQAEPEATLHSPAFAGACPGVHSPPPGCHKRARGISEQSAK